MKKLKYYCFKCKRNHFYDSNIGKKHLQIKSINIKTKKQRLEWLKTIMQLKLNDKQRGYYEWSYENSELVDMKHTNKINSIIDKFVKSYEPELKGCFSTAMNCTVSNSDVDYVEGYIVTLGVPIQHAWNSYKGKYFDITDYKLFNNEMGDHYKIIEIPRQELIKDFMLKYERTGAYLSDYYMDKINKSKNQNNT